MPKQITLLDFQQEAADKIRDAILAYFSGQPDRLGGREIPFVGQLKAVTGAGKTPILTEVISYLDTGIVLWTTKFGSVVDQTFNNLIAGGKYHHLIASTVAVEVIKLGDIPSAAEWQRILENDKGITVLVSTVAAWNSNEKDQRLNVHRINPDWGNKSRWEQLKTERKRPLWIVYDEAHNTTTDQVELLDDLDPAGFLVASASPLKGKILQYLSLLSEAQRQKRVISVSTRAVVDAQLLKSTIAIADYDSTTEEMIDDMVQRFKLLGNKFSEAGSKVKPRAIYVVESSNATIAAGPEPRPITLWNILVNKCGVSSDSIAICTDTRNLPPTALKVDTIDQLSDQFSHIIFNKKLQEGWDDPSVYLCYFDGETKSATRIQQVLGRALRQPEASHYTDQELNTAYFFINCPNEALESITDELKEELRIYKSGDDLDDFEPFQVRQERRDLQPIALKAEQVGKLEVPYFRIELPMIETLIKLIKGRTFSFNDDERASPGKALVSIVSVKTGETKQSVRDLLEDMRVRCGSYLQNQIKVLSKGCANSLPPATFSNEKLDKTACYGSQALTHYAQLATEVVREYESHVQLKEAFDPTVSTYLVKAYTPSGNVPKPFVHAGHPYYDTKAFNADELMMARELDKFAEYVWVRNKDRVGYGIELPIKSGTSSNFYPDFLWWVKNTVWVIDPTGQFILKEKLRTKLLDVPPPMKIALVTKGKLRSDFSDGTEDGWTLARRRMGITAPEPFNSLEELLKTLERE